ncbi:MAG: ABC transporter permease subunit [Anaerolineae bacterium]|nr:ABC transporter permease subunit [Anaerolineae bacterium]MCB0178257.1 ABC transporter permease subunit [Anaerolineae bacterium]MCB9104100.1 ABC transporter permease subunit [Anaerolineales bacterium]
MVSWQSISGYIQIHKRDVTYLIVLVIILLLPLIVDSLTTESTDFPEAWDIHLREPLDNFQRWTIRNRLSHPLFTWFFDPISDAIDGAIRQIELFLLWLPWQVVVLAIFLVGQAAAGFRVALFSAFAILFMGFMGLWDEGMLTLALMAVSVVIALLIGIPLGILAARSDRFEAALRPLLDVMQTLPAFVYLIPVLLFFGIARVPSVIATVIYALPPAIRLTNLGIRQVTPSAVEAARAFGSTPRQTLFKVQIPLAMPTIIAGVNQTIMMAFGIVVIAALIGAGGLGNEVLIALQKQQVGRGFIAGMAIVFMAILLDRISHGFSQQQTVTRSPHDHGFHLLPNSWDRFAAVRGFERGLAFVMDGCAWLARRVAAGVATLAGAIIGLTGRKEAAASTAGFLRGHAFLVTSVLLLGGMLVINSIAPYGQEFPESWVFDLGQPVDTGVDWMRDNLYQIGDTPIGTGPLSDFLLLYTLNPIRAFLQDWLSWPLVILGVAVIAYSVGGWRLAIFSAAGLFVIGLLGLWDDTMNTFSQVIVAVLLTVLISIPLGVLSARSDTVEAFLKPILDTLQTIPFFVYLIPVIILFNVGRIPGIIASVLYALPPGIRLTNLGIRQISSETIEAARAFGSTPRQTLFKVQLPLALPAIALGVNQVIMMVLAMVVVAGLVGGGGLGLLSVKGLANPMRDLGRGIEAGIAIVILAMILDRITQAWAKNREIKGHH